MRLRCLALDHLIELGDSMPRAIAIGEPLSRTSSVCSAQHPDTLAPRRLAAAYEDSGRVAEAIRIRADPDRAGTAAGPDDPDTMRSRTTWPAPTERQAGSPTQSRWSSRSLRPGSAYSVPTIPAPSRRGTISPARTGLPAGPPRPPLVREERGRMRAAVRCRSPQDPGLAAQPRPRPPGVGAGRERRADDHRLPRLACSRSIASNSALKLPLPNPCEPCRSISSKKTVGRSCTGWVKICSR